MRLNNRPAAQLRVKAISFPYFVFSLVTSVLLGFVAATQFAAFHYRFAPELGQSFQHFYNPISIFFWGMKWHESDPQTFKQAGMIGASSFLVALMVLVMAGRGQRYRLKQVLHGSAQWATKKEIKRMGILTTGKKGDSVAVGAWLDNSGNSQYLTHSGPEHCLAIAPTRSGKGVGLVLPTLLGFWTQSCVVSDLKAELYSLTSGWRKLIGNKILRFEPAALEGSACWNPLLEIRIGTAHEVGDVQNIAKIIFDVDGKGTEGDHWASSAESLVTGLILHLLYRQKEKATFDQLDAMLSRPDSGITELYSEMTSFRHFGTKVHPVVAQAGRDQIDRPQNEAGSIVSTAKRYLSLYRDPVVARNISRSDFFIKDLMNDEDPVSLYIITQPTDKARLRPLVRMMITTIMRILCDKQEFVDGRAVANYKHKLLLMLDEFPSLGKLEIMQESMAFCAGYGLKCYLITQDITQLHSAYGKDESVSSQCHIQVAFPPNRIETAEHISKMTGDTTYEINQLSFGTSLFPMASRSMQQVGRKLMTPDEALRMSGPKKDSNGSITEAGDMIVFVAGFPPVYAKQPLYFQDDVFLARAKVPPVPSDKIR